VVRTVKHFALHRIAGTELRVVSEVEMGVLRLIEMEEAVIQGYTACQRWPHRCVTLFVLNDLQPLVRELRSGAQLPPGEIGTLDSRPLVNVYDLADLRTCHVFVNEQVMAKEGYWDDATMVKALLAHEHSHPIAENATTRLFRQLRLQLSLTGGGRRPATSSQPAPAEDYDAQLLRVLTGLAEKLCLYAPREIFANEITIQSNFGEALLHLNRLNVGNAVRSIAGRDDLLEQLQKKVAQGQLDSATADVLLLAGDLNGYLDLALEIVPFYRTGQETSARELEAALKTIIFPRLEPQVSQVYVQLCCLYLSLNADMNTSESLAWSREVLSSLTSALAERGVTMHYNLEMKEELYA
jgi:hypothetical protein